MNERKLEVSNIWWHGSVVMSTYMRMGMHFKCTLNKKKQKVKAKKFHSFWQCVQTVKFIKEPKSVLPLLGKIKQFRLPTQIKVFCFTKIPY